VPTPISGGDGFERFIAAGLQSCGVRVRHSLKLHDTVGGNKPMREIDVVAYHGGKLVCIDIKLPAAADAAKGTQLADIAELTKSLGGPAALAIALRPGWPEDAEIARLAKALNVRLLTQAHAPRVFTELITSIDPDLQPSPDVLEVESRLMGWARLGHAVLSDSRHLPPNAINDHGLLSVSALVQDLALRHRRCWVVAHLPGGKLLVWIDKKSPHAPHWSAEQEINLSHELERLGHWTLLSKGAATVSGLLSPLGGVKTQAVQLRLGQLLGMGEIL
jgi:Holliday junction resolvase